MPAALPDPANDRSWESARGALRAPDQPTAFQPGGASAAACFYPCSRLDGKARAFAAPPVPCPIIPQPDRDCDLTALAADAKSCQVYPTRTPGCLIGRWGAQNDSNGSNIHFALGLKKEEFSGSMEVMPRGNSILRIYIVHLIKFMENGSADSSILLRLFNIFGTHNFP